MTIRLLVIGQALLLMAASCAQPEFLFDTQICEPLGARDELPPWPPAEDLAPAPNGPTIDFGEVEFVGREDGCRDAAVVTLDGHDAEGDVSEQGLDASLFVYAISADFLDTIEIFDLQKFSRDDDQFTARAEACVHHLDQRGRGIYLHVVDDAGNGSNAFCARAFARSGVDLPAPPQGP